MISSRTHVLVHSELPLPPGELTDGDDGGEGDARNEHHVEPGQGGHAHLVTAGSSNVLAGAATSLLLPPLLLQPGHHALLYQADDPLRYGGRVGRI